MKETKIIHVPIVTPLLSGIPFEKVSINETLLTPLSELVLASKLFQCLRNSTQWRLRTDRSNVDGMC